MSVESASRVDQLNATLPEDGDFISEGAAHLRTLKQAIKASLPVGLDGMSQSAAVNSVFVVEDSSGRKRAKALPAEDTAKLLRDQRRIVKVASVSAGVDGGLVSWTSAVQDDFGGFSAPAGNVALPVAVTGSAGARCLVLRWGFRIVTESVTITNPATLPFLIPRVGSTEGGSTYANGLILLDGDSSSFWGNRTFSGEARIFSLAANAPLYFSVDGNGCSADLSDVWLELTLER